MATTAANVVDRSHFLRRALQANAVFSVVTGAIAVVGAGPISRFLGLDSAWIVVVIGVGVLFWAGYALLVSRESPLDKLKVVEIIAGDLLWVAASLAIIMSGWPELSSEGQWLIAVIAEVVLMFAVLQFVGLRKIRA